MTMMKIGIRQIRQSQLGASAPRLETDLKTEQKKEATTE
jgi:hypothetical protein